MKTWHFGLFAAAALALVLGLGARAITKHPAASSALKPIPSGLSKSLTKTLLGYDRDGDGRVTPEELPQAMRPLVEMGDTGHDGALDAGEISHLADRVCQDAEKGLLPSARAALSAPSAPASTHMRLI